MIENYYESGLIETSGDFCGAQRVAALDHAVLPMSKIEQHLLERSPANFGDEKIWENEMSRSDALTEDIATKCEADDPIRPSDISLESGQRANHLSLSRK